MIIPIASAHIEVPPSPDGYVLDQAEILSAETEAALEAQLAALETGNSSQIVVVTIETLEGYPIESYTLEIGRTWGVGQEEFNNGTIFLIAEQDREARIEVGYGLEGAITDAQAFSIINQVAIPYFKEGNFDQGVLESVAYLDTLARGEEFALEELPTPDLPVEFLLVMFYLILTLGWALISWFSSSKAWWAGGIFGATFGWFFAGGFLGLGLGALGGLLFDLILSTYFYKRIRGPRGSGWWFFGGGRGGKGGGSSGSFGGFGGGGFGGGGASGRW